MKQAFTSRRSVSLSIGGLFIWACGANNNTVPAAGGASSSAGSPSGVSGQGATAGVISVGGASIGSAGTLAAGGQAQTASGGDHSVGTSGAASGGTSNAAGASTVGGASVGGAAVGGSSGAIGAAGTSAAGAGGSKNASGKITVWMAGDSTMDTGVCTGCGPTACGWGGQFQPLFKDNVSVVNRGKSGASIQTWLYGDTNVSDNKDANGECIVTTTTYDPRWSGMLDATTGMKAGDYLYIEFGINDDGTLCNRRVGPDLFQKYLTYMAQEAKKRGAQAIFATSTAALECTGAMAQVDRNFRTETKASGVENDVPVIDLTQITASYYTSQGFCPNNADYTSTTSKVGQFFCNDHTHFELLGAKQIAQLVAQALKDQNIGLAAYLK